MGKHSPPINGTLMPFTIPPSMQPRGPWSVLPRPSAPRRSVSARVIESCYVLMAAVTVIGTAVGFWLSYAGLHSFAVQAGLSGPEAWAWPASVDLFILVGELGITISALRDGRTDWRAWGYFAAGCGPSVTFNVLHVTQHFPPWGKYAVAATPPVAAVLALAALMQQVLSLPDALQHMHARQQPVTPAVVTPAVTPPVTPPVTRARPQRKAVTARRPAALTKQAAAAAVIRDNPGITDNAALAKLAGCDVRTVQRARNGKPGSRT
jgi:Protein of unknown function (DUF2637)